MELMTGPTALSGISWDIGRETPPQLLKRDLLGLLQYIPSDIAEVDDVFGRCNVIMTTEQHSSANAAPLYRIGSPLTGVISL